MEEKMSLSVHADRRIKPLKDLFGIFFEDLNHAADGGLYAEMVQNRSFEYSAQDVPDYHALTAWEKVERGQALVKLHVEHAHPLNQVNPHYLVLDVARTGFGGVSNQGYNQGMRLCKGKKYFFSCWYSLRTRHPAEIQVRLESADGQRCHAQGSMRVDDNKWHKIELELIPSDDDTSARLVIGFAEPISIALDHVSLFPEDTYQGRRNGLRADLVQMLKDMHPKFCRFPGGCLVHCGSLHADDHESMYRWKKTLGPVEERPSWRNIWSHQQTLGLGFYEYFLLCEDIGAQPLPVLPAGWDPHTQRAAPLEEMQEWVDDALDLVEFANGETDTVWGRRRAEMGHPKPFGLKYLAIGNEEVGDEFFQRYEIIHKAVRDRYPQIQLIASAGPGCAGNVFEQGWQHARKMHANYVDEHYYQSPDWLIAHMHRYDSYDIQSPQAFLGEYASRGCQWWNALVEGAYMLGLEKAPGVGMACYAPLFCNAAYVNWTPDLIWFDNRQVYGTASYYVQKLMMCHQGDWEVETQQSGGSLWRAEPSTAQGGIGFVSERTDIEIADLVLTNTDTGETREFAPLHLGKKQPRCSLGDVHWENYRLTFRACRHTDCDETHYVARYPFVLEFGKKDQDNLLRWIIDGWMNLSSLAQLRHGEFCELTASLVPSEKEKWQCYGLEVKGDRLAFTIDGKVYPSATLCQPDLEPLYTSASIEDVTGELMVKAVNLQPRPALVELTVHGFNVASVEVYEMSGYDKRDENSFEAPQKVVPKHRVAAPSSSWTFPPESLTILRLKRA